MAGTLIGIFLEAVTAHRKQAQFLRKRQGRWEPISAEQALADVEACALGLRGLGVTPGDRVALLAENRYEWAVADLAVVGLGAITVPIYPTLTSEQIRRALEHSECGVAIVSTPALLEKIDAVADTLPLLHSVVHMEPAAATHAKHRSWDAVTGHGIFARGRMPLEFRSTANLVRPDQVATIIYTSGTTGEPKGAVLTHANIVSNVEACLKVVPLLPGDSSLSFLPLCHVFERMGGLYAMLAAGVSIAYPESLEKVVANMNEVRPTVITGVPRFYEKVYARAMEQAMALPALRKNVFFWGLHQGRARARAHFAGKRLGAGGRLASALGDALVGRRIRGSLGGRLRLCISGGAPLPPRILEFFYAAGIPVLEGYGLSETSPVICLSPPGHERPGSVGPPIPGVQVRIGPDGEVLTRGPHVMRGYYRNDAATRAAIREGWFHTGDVGHLEPDGSLIITDRLKDLLVTAGGKKVAPQPLEAQLKSGRWVTEAVLIGDSQPFVSCLIVPDFRQLEAEAQARHWKAATRAELLALPEVRALFQHEVDVLNAGLAPFEQVKRFALLDHELTLEGGELTPTLKVKRRVILERYAGPIAELYAPAVNRSAS